MGHGMNAMRRRKRNENFGISMYINVSFVILQCYGDFTNAARRFTLITKHTFDASPWLGRLDDRSRGF